MLSFPSPCGVMEFEPDANAEAIADAVGFRPLAG